MKLKDYLSEETDDNKLPRQLGKEGKILRADVKMMKVGQEWDVYEIGTGDKKYAKVVRITDDSVVVRIAGGGKFQDKETIYKIV